MTPSPLKKKKEFLQVKKKARKYTGAFLFADIAEEEKGCFFGIAASKKYGNACIRNRFKRQVKEAFRDLGVSGDFSLIVYPKMKAQKEKTPSLKKDLLEVIASFLKDHGKTL